ncbi:MAG: hypothetical protein DMF14_12760 [Verrucomicrobia bacterium]|nr:MAG: hypothetical protein DME40_04745 [Verrucomicrobiota bacterium]PYL89549.1 MAG: hypothetical protein DMF14_12760 [Verrucomicrobiota bacterium]
MIRLAALTFVLALVAAGCRTAENVASTSAAVVTAPAHFVRNKLRGDEQPTTETTVYEGQPVEAMPPQASATPFRPSRTVTSTTSASPPSQPDETRPSTAVTPWPSATPRSSSSNAAAQFPVAKPVPGKPGYVFSPYDPNGGYVDVTGYQSGSKVKDPYSQKIFLVP